MAIRTDLALESFQAASQASGKEVEGLPGIRSLERDRAGCRVTEIIVENDQAGAPIGKGKGRYLTFETPRLSGHPGRFEGVPEALAEELKSLLPDLDTGTAQGEVLVAGLGNLDITPDALGPLAARKVLATRHFARELLPEDELASLRGVVALAPGVLGQTGVEAAEVISALCEKIHPAAVIAMDALACSDVNRLGCTIQLADSGISPGSGVQNRRKELSRRTLGVPVIAMGVPTVADLASIAEQMTGSPASERTPAMMVTPRDIDQLIFRTAGLLSRAVNLALQPSLTAGELDVLMPS